MAGKSFQDRELAARVRAITLEQCEKILKKKKGKLYEQVLLKLASSILPRLNEISGEDGRPIVIKIAEEIAEQNDIKSRAGNNR